MHVRIILNLINMRKCGLMFGLLIIVLVIASKVTQADENENLVVALELQVKQP